MWCILGSTLHYILTMTPLKVYIQTERFAMPGGMSVYEHCGLPTLAVRRKLLKLCFLYRLMVGDYTFSDAPLRPRYLDPWLRSSNSCLLFSTFHLLLCIHISPTLYLCGTLSHYHCVVFYFLTLNVMFWPTYRMFLTNHLLL